MSLLFNIVPCPLILVVNGEGKGDELWPFGYHYFDIEFYGVKDFIFYMIAPTVLYIIQKLIGGDIKKKIKKPQR